VLGMILLEAALIGLSAGGAGVVCALVAGLAVDAAASIVVPDFPFKPESFFQFSWWLIAGSLALAVMAAVAGALIPARRAASASPARVLNGR
jgi:putative ABC transport system permease protein